MSREIIAGSGGSSSASTSTNVSVEDPNTLRSKSYFTIIDLLGEGEWEEVGVDGLKGVYFDSVVAQNEDDTYNFSGISFETKTGTVDQTPLSLSAGTASTFSVGIAVTKELPITKIVNVSEADYARVIVGVTRLSVQDSSTGDTHGTSVQYTIEYKNSASTSWIMVPSQTGDTGGIQTISGKSTSAYEKETSFSLTGSGPFSFRVTRITNDSTSDLLANATVFQAVSVVSQDKYCYPFSVLAAVSGDATQFSSIPTRNYLCKMTRVKVPNNYDPIARTYTGFWNGGFKVAWTDNPAWCWRDLITNSRYGLGDRIPESYIDDGALYEISQYCDELVSDGNGGTEPRFTCNMLINSRSEAYQVISDMASIFRGISYWASGTIVASQDRPRDAVYAFSNANVVDGTFTYTSSNIQTRYNAVMTTYNDPDQLYTSITEFVADDAQIAKLGYINQGTLNNIGCTSRSMAVRAARWLLYTNTYETDLVTFQTSLEGAIPLPGEVIKVSDTLRALDRRSGRIISFDGTTIVLDAAYDFTSYGGGTISMIDTDGAIFDLTFVATTETNILTVTTTSKRSAENGVYVLALGDAPTSLYRVVSVKEDNAFTYTINATTYNPDKYDMVEDGDALHGLVISTQYLGAVTDAVAEEVLYLDGVSYKSKVSVSWKAPSKATQYELYIVCPDKQTITLKQSNLSYEILNAIAGTYKIYITAVDVIGNRAQAYSTQVLVDGMVDAPATIQNLKFTSLKGQGYLSWTVPSNVSVTVGGSIEIRYVALGSTVAWGTATYIETVSGGTNQAIVPLQKGTYLVKAINTQGTYSDDFAAVASNYFVDGQITGLALETAFSGRTLALMWDVYGDATKYQVALYTGSTLKKTLTTTDTRISIGITDLVSWGLSRNIVVYVTGMNDSGLSTLPGTLSVTKAQCSAPSISVQDTSSSLIVTASVSSDAAYKNTRVCISQTSGFNPDATTPYYDGPQTSCPTGTIASGVWYVRACQYDLFGADSLNWTTQVSITVTATASGVQHVADAGSIVGTIGGDPPGGKDYLAVYDDKTQKMWTWDSTTGKYTCAVSAEDVATAVSTAVTAAVTDIDADISALDGEITTLSSSVTGGGNLLVNPAFEVDLSGWSVGWQQINTDQTATLSRDLLGTLHSAPAHSMTLMREGTPTGLQDAVSSIVDVEPGARVCVSARVINESTASQIGTFFYDANGTYITESWAAQIPAHNVTGLDFSNIANWQKSFAFFTVPATARGIRFAIRQVPTGTSSPRTYVERPQLEIASAAQTQPSPWAYSAAGILTAVKTVSDATSANATAIQQVSAAVSSETTSRTAAVTAEQQARADGDGALATSINQVSARLNDGGDIKSAIVQVTSQATATDGKLAGSWAVQIDANNKLAGIKLLNDGTTSTLTIDADNTIINGTVTTNKLAAAAVTADKIQAGSVTADKVSVSQLSAISANLGSITAGQINLSSSGWQYIRSKDKWWYDSNNGFIFAGTSDGSCFQEFKAVSGSISILERKSLGASVGQSYLTSVTDSAGVERFVIDPYNSRFVMKGTIYADSGYFSGTLNSASGTFGTITSGYLQNSDNSASLNLGASGSTAFLRSGSKTLITANGETSFNNVIFNQVCSFTPTVVVTSLYGWNDAETPDWIWMSTTNGCAVSIDTGLTYSAPDFNKITFGCSVTGWGATYESSVFRLLCSATPEAALPGPGETWTGVKLRVLVHIWVGDQSGNVYPLDENTANLFAQGAHQALKVSSLTICVNKLT